MDVYLVPVGPDRHELYCEVPDEIDDQDAAAESTDAKPGFFRRLRLRFREMLAEAERERRQARTTRVEGGWLTRIKTRVMRWVAESIAEQRLLWHLRSQTEACLYYPDDLDEARAVAVLKTQLKSDFEKHRFWLAIDSLLFIVSGLLALVPGPNFLAYYFAFRLVGHYLSLRGARNGLSGFEWKTEKSDALSELRRAIGLAPDARDRRVHEVATRLRLEHLPSFFERTAVPMS
ncbi:MAG TPA: hypothetical protein VH740_24130 [Vicinamibacterales bacterium]|jgi:hypothetical protein